jgi:hypothetical protein
MKEQTKLEVGQIATDLINDYSITEQECDQLLTVMHTFLSKGLYQWQFLAIVGDIFKIVECDSEIAPIKEVLERYFEEYQKNCEA